MKKLLILLLLCSCANIPEGKRMKCTNLGRGVQQCENEDLICINNSSRFKIRRNLESCVKK